MAKKKMSRGSNYYEPFGTMDSANKTLRTYFNMMPRTKGIPQSYMSKEIPMANMIGKKGKDY